MEYWSTLWGNREQNLNLVFVIYLYVYPHWAVMYRNICLKGCVLVCGGMQMWWWMQSGCTIVHCVELVYNLQGLHPSPSLMDGGVCSETERGVEIGWRIASWRPPSTSTPDKESPLQFGARLVHATGYQRYRDESWIQRWGFEVSREGRCLGEGWWRYGESRGG